jgi:hypothetical protein
MTKVFTKLPSNRLCLVYEFDIPELVVSPSESEHDVAVQKAATATGKVAATSVRATAYIRSNPSISSVQHEPFDPTFHVANGGPAARFEFVYDDKHPKMFVRIVTSLGDTAEMIIDGVLATRIALHTMELLEGNEMSKSIFPEAAPLHYSWRHRVNFFQEIFGTKARVIFAEIHMWIAKRCSFFMDSTLSPSRDVTEVNDAVSLFQFYESMYADQPASYKLYRPELIGFKGFVGLLEEWRREQDMWGFFYLINFSPKVAAGSSSRVQDITSLSARYRGAFVPPGAGPPPFLWELENPRLSRQIFVNNYGRHQHHFQAKPVAYVWDWLEMAAPLKGCGCITINGVFLCWNRGMPSALDESKNPFTRECGEPIATTQNQEWFSKMGPWKPQGQ